MACCDEDACCSTANSERLNSAGWRRALWIALLINAGFFVAEFAAGAAAGSAALQADALDFFGDAANYAISLGVAGMAIAWRSHAAVAKGGTLIAFALWVLGSTVWHAFYGTPSTSRSHGRGGRRGIGRQWRRSSHALSLPHRGREYAFRLDLFAQ